MTARLKCKNTTTVAGLTMLLRFYDSTIKIYSLYFVECTRKFQNGWKWKRYGVWVCFRFEIRLACADYRRREESGRLPGEKRCNLDLAFFFQVSRFFGTVDIEAGSHSAQRPVVYPDWSIQPYLSFIYAPCRVSFRVSLNPRFSGQICTWLATRHRLSLPYARKFSQSTFDWCCRSW